MWHKISLGLSLGLVLIMACLTVAVNFLIPQPDHMTDQDIYFSYVEGQRLQHGENPYARVLTGDMLQNQKYATYFPVFYELSSLSEGLGLHAFPDWMAFWRIVFMVFELATAGLFYVSLARRNLEWGGVLAAAFWLFNRWTLQVVQTQNMDFIPIFFLLLSLELFPRKSLLSLFFLSLSLGMKQIAIFLVPLYIIWIFRAAGRQWIQKVAGAALAIASIPILSGLPFLIWNAQGFFQSVFFSATRSTAVNFRPFSLDVLMGWSGFPARFALFALVLLVYVVACQGYGEKYVYGLLSTVRGLGRCFGPAASL